MNCELSGEHQLRLLKIVLTSFLLFFFFFHFKGQSGEIIESVYRCVRFI